MKIGVRVGSGYPPLQRRAMQMLSLDARKSVEKFIEDYGADAFDLVVKAVSDPHFHWLHHHHFFFFEWKLAA